jgi:hypothetical protein
MQSRPKRIGIAILRVLAENALESIPVYGTYIRIGLDIINAVKEEVSKDTNQLLTDDEIVRALRSLTYDEATQTDDTVLESSKAASVMEQLSPAQREEIRRKLSRTAKVL